MNSITNDITTAYCNTCLGETDHKILATHRKQTDDTEHEVYWIDIYQMLDCCGCHTICFYLEEYFSEMDYQDTGARTRYPPATKRRRPKWIDKLPDTLQNLLSEVYTACAVNSRSLTAMGIRAIIDGVANDKVGDVGCFKKKLNELKDKGYLTSDQAGVLETAFEVGSATMHRAYNPKPEILDNLLEITEHLLQQCYVLRDVAKQLEVNTPKRQKKS